MRDFLGHCPFVGDIHVQEQSKNVWLFLERNYAISCTSSTDYTVAIEQLYCEVIFVQYIFMHVHVSYTGDTEIFGFLKAFRLTWLPDFPLELERCCATVLNGGCKSISKRHAYVLRYIMAQVNASSDVKKREYMPKVPDMLLREI